MNGQQPPRPQAEAIDPKVELANAKINLTNLKFQTQMTEAVIKKLEELTR